MELTEPLSWRDCLATEFPGRDAWIAHPDGELVTAEQLAPTRPRLFLIGPEGGFTETEVEEAVAAGARRMQLGPRILRIETAVVAIAALACLYEP